jgi:ribosomal protein L20A (L18A)
MGVTKLAAQKKISRKKIKILEFSEMARFQKKNFSA